MSSRPEYAKNESTLFLWKVECILERLCALPAMPALKTGTGYKNRKRPVCIEIACKRAVVSE